MENKTAQLASQAWWAEGRRAADAAASRPLWSLGVTPGPLTFCL